MSILLCANRADAAVCSTCQPSLPQVRGRIELTAQMQASLEEISQINLELLNRRQLD